MASLKFACVLLLCMIIGAPIAQAALSCNDVNKNVLPCLPYLKNGGPSVPRDCCAGVTTLNNQAKTKADRQTACNCLKNAAATIKGLNPNLVAGLPKSCGVNIPYKISPSTDCNM
ncbi:non-specific lipid-transfer protein 1-like [Fagus crenata]|uniref:Non-specific lipid-transfer protein n=1 Tax=Fagus sylvatica TaxID=28930 RepID=A0A2N9I2D3_FAGSY